MKQIVFFMLVLFNLQAFAADYNGFKIEPADFEDMASGLEGVSSQQKGTTYFPYWQTSVSACHAYTRCPNGRTVYCKTYGYNYSAVPSYMNNSCRFMVLPGRGVRCQGYAVQRDFYGRAMWSYVDIPVSCGF